MITSQRIHLPTVITTPQIPKSCVPCTTLGTILGAALIRQHNLETRDQLRNGAQRTRMAASLDSLMESQKRLEVQNNHSFLSLSRCYNCQIVRWKVEQQKGGSFSATTLCNDVKSAGEGCHGQTHCFITRSTLEHLRLTRQQMGEVRGRTSSTPRSLPYTASALVLGKR